LGLWNNMVCCDNPLETLCFTTNRQTVTCCGPSIKCDRRIRSTTKHDSLVVRQLLITTTPAGRVLTQSFTAQSFTAHSQSFTTHQSFTIIHCSSIIHCSFTIIHCSFIITHCSFTIIHNHSLLIHNHSLLNHSLLIHNHSLRIHCSRHLTLALVSLASIGSLPSRQHRLRSTITWDAL